MSIGTKLSLSNCLTDASLPAELEPEVVEAAETVEEAIIAVEEQVEAAY